MPKCLITGSCGFLFSNFIRKAIYNKLDFEFVSIDKVNNSSNLHNIYANKGHKFYIGDVTDPHLVDLIFKIEKPDVIIHGADSKGPDCIAQNIIGTQILMEACARYDVGRMIYISTDEVYGTLYLNPNPLQSSHPWFEDSPYKPMTQYSASKASSELVLRSIMVENNCKTKVDILRLCNVFGPRQATHNFVPNIIKNVLENQPVVLEDQGQRVRDWLYIEDFCNLLIVFLTNRYSHNSIQTCNVSAGYEFSDLEIFHEVTKSLNQGVELLSFDKQPLRWEKSSSRPSDTVTTGLGWKPTWKVRAAIAQTCNWYLNNKWFLNI